MTSHVRLLMWQTHSRFLFFVCVPGFSPLSTFVNNEGIRSEPASAMLKPAMMKENLHVLTGAHVTRVRNNWWRPFYIYCDCMRTSHTCIMCFSRSRKMCINDDNWTLSQKLLPGVSQDVSDSSQAAVKSIALSVSGQKKSGHFRFCLMEKEQLELNMWKMVDSKLR